MIKENIEKLASKNSTLATGTLKGKRNHSANANAAMNHAAHNNAASQSVNSAAGAASLTVDSNVHGTAFNKNGKVTSPSLASAPSSPTLSNQGNGGHHNNRKKNLYKTELCRSTEETGECPYGTKCQFAHTLAELRTIDRHPRYKTEMCKTFWEHGRLNL
jgi:hypothetical protein